MQGYSPAHSYRSGLNGRRLRRKTMLKTSRKTSFRILVLACGLLLAGCSSLTAPPSSKPVRYACDEGRQFSIAFLPDAGGANIEINRMRFHLRREAAAEMRYACDVLTFTGSGDTAEVAIQDAPAYRNCRAER
jgi:hypothetical protein